MDPIDSFIVISSFLLTSLVYPFGSFASSCKAFRALICNSKERCDRSLKVFLWAVVALWSMPLICGSSIHTASYYSIVVCINRQTTYSANMKIVLWKSQWIFRFEVYCRRVGFSQARSRFGLLFDFPKIIPR